MIERIRGPEERGSTAASLVLHLGWLLLLVACGIASLAAMGDARWQPDWILALAGASWISSLAACVASIRRLERHARLAVRGEYDRRAEDAQRFLGEVPILREELSAAVEAMDLAGLAWWACRLGDAAADLGAPSLRQAASRLEEAARSGDPARADKARAALEQSLDHLCDTLTRELTPAD